MDRATAATRAKNDFMFEIGRLGEKRYRNQMRPTKSPAAAFMLQTALEFLAVQPQYTLKYVATLLDRDANLGIASPYTF